jgi:integrase
MGRRPEIGNVQLYPDRPLRASDKNGYVLKFYCPIRQTRVRRNSGTRDRREARRVLRECRERLLNGEYVASGGAITIALQQANVRACVQDVLSNGESQSWQACYDQYYAYLKPRSREKSLGDAASRIEIAGRILDADRELKGLPPDGPIRQYATLPALEHLQESLLDGDEGIFEQRAPMTVNTMVGAVMAFFRYCKRHGLIDDVPALAKLDVEEVMKGRPITVEEFQAMLAVVPEVVGKRGAASWRYVLEILWETAFRVGDVMNFSWDDSRRIHPVWPVREGEFPTLNIPASQKNKKVQQVPMLPGLQTLLERTPPAQRHGWVVTPLPFDAQPRSRVDWFKPAPQDLESLAHKHSNSTIARTCGVSEAAVRKWLVSNGLERDVNVRSTGDISERVVADVRARAEQILSAPVSTTARRLTKDYVGRVISDIGERANIIVRAADEETGQRVKYASAHDIRRGCAQRLINAGVSAETLKIILRHEDFKTTEKFYGAVREAQAAAAEVHQMLQRTKNPDKKTALVGGLVGGQEVAPQLSPAELLKLKALLNSI